MISRTRATIAAAFLTCVLALTGCAPEGPSEAIDQPNPSAPSSAPESPVEQSSGPATQEETCDWDTARLNSGSADIPGAESGELTTVIIGAWQHTHIDSGAGFEAVAPTTDIRYVFPSTTRMLYCQDVQGAIFQAENAVDIGVDGTELVLPSPATGYAVTAWDGDTMVWTNHRDGSLYLLKRR